MPPRRRSIWNKQFWIDTFERCLSAFFGTYLTLMGVHQVADYLHRPAIAWDLTLFAMLLATSLEFARCMVAATRGSPGSASLLK